MTGEEYLNLVSKRILNFEDLDSYYLGYLRENLSIAMLLTYLLDGTFFSKVVISADGNDKFKLSESYGHDGNGQFCATEATYCEGVQFENNSGTEYSIGIRPNPIPKGIQINPRTGYPEYERWREELGQVANPASVEDLGSGDVKVRLPTSMCVSDRTYAGRKAVVWKKDPEKGATEEAVAIQELTVSYGGGYNYVTATDYLGGDAFDSTVGNYQVQLMGPSVARKTEKNYETDSNHWFIGTLTGTGSGNPPGGFNNTDQRLFEWTLGAATEAWNQHNERLLNASLENWHRQYTDPSTRTEYLWDMCYSPDDELLLVVGGNLDNGGIQYCNDGVNWNGEQPDGTPTELRGCAYGNNMYIVVGPSGYIAKGTWGGSGTGWTWATQSAAGSYTGTFNDVYYDAGNTRFVAVGTGGEIQTSTNGTTWVQCTSGTSNTLAAVWHDGVDKWVAVGNSGTIRTATELIITTAGTWSTESLGSSSTVNLWDVTFGNGMWVTVGAGGELQVSAVDPDNWTRVLYTGNVDDVGWACEWVESLGQFLVGMEYDNTYPEGNNLLSCPDDEADIAASWVIRPAAWNGHSPGHDINFICAAWPKGITIGGENALLYNSFLNSWT